MTKKLLITGGDSWSSLHEGYYKEAGMDKIWPGYVSEFFDWDVIHTGLSGAGNDYIHNTVIDAIEANSDRDIVVMVMWSQAIRSVPFDLPIGQLTFNVHAPPLNPPFGPVRIEAQVALRKLASLHVKCYDSKRDKGENIGQLNSYAADGMDQNDFYRWIARWSLRNIYLLNDYCKQRNISIIHHKSLNIFNGIEWILDPIFNHENKRLMNKAVRSENPINHYYHKIKEWDNVVGPDLFQKGSDCYSLYPKYFLNKLNPHVNAKGMQLIGHTFINKYIEVYEERSTSEADYVYN